MFQRLHASFVVVLCLWGCHGLPGKAGLTEIESRAANLDFNQEELKLRLTDFSRLFSSVVEATADDIRERSSDPEIQRAALTWKMEALPAGHLAAFRPQPLGALLDLWALCVQMKHYLTDGSGATRFGSFQPVAVRAATGLEEEILEVVKKTVPDPDLVAWYSRLVEEWAEAHPIEGSFSTRRSCAPVLASYAVESSGAFVAVESVEEHVRDLKDQLHIYAEFLPKQARWQAETLVDDLLAKEEIGRAEKNLDSLAGALVKVGESVDRLPDLVDYHRAAITADLSRELRAVLSSIDEQRSATLEELSRQRELVLEALVRERRATIEELKAERVATIRDVEAVTVRDMDELTPRLQSWIDHFFLRVVQLLGVVVLLGIVGFLLYRGRRNRRSSPSASERVQAGAEH